MSNDVWSLAKRGDLARLKALLADQPRGPASTNCSSPVGYSLATTEDGGAEGPLPQQSSWAKERGGSIRTPRLAEKMRWTTTLPSELPEGVGYMRHPHRLTMDRHVQSGVTPLHRAAAAGAIDVCRYLIEEQGVDINMRSTWGWYAPLHLAARHGHEQLCEYLIEKGGRWHMKDKHGKTCLDYAVDGSQSVMAWRLQRVASMKQTRDRREAAAAELASAAKAAALISVTANGAFNDAAAPRQQPTAARDATDTTVAKDTPEPSANGGINKKKPQRASPRRLKVKSSPSGSPRARTPRSSTPRGTSPPPRTPPSSSHKNSTRSPIHRSPSPSSTNRSPPSRQRSNRSPRSQA